MLVSKHKVDGSAGGAELRQNTRYCSSHWNPSDTRCTARTATTARRLRRSNRCHASLGFSWKLSQTSQRVLGLRFVRLAPGSIDTPLVARTSRAWDYIRSATHRPEKRSHVAQLGTHWIKPAYACNRPFQMFAEVALPRRKHVVLEARAI